MSVFSDRIKIGRGAKGIDIQPVAVCVEIVVMLVPVTEAIRVRLTCGCIRQAGWCTPLDSRTRPVHAILNRFHCWPVLDCAPAKRRTGFLLHLSLVFSR